MLTDLRRGVRAVSLVALPGVALGTVVVTYLLLDTPDQDTRTAVAVGMGALVFLGGQPKLWANYLRGFGMVRFASLREGRSGGAIAARPGAASSLRPPVGTIRGSDLARVEPLPSFRASVPAGGGNQINGQILGTRISPEPNLTPLPEPTGMTMQPRTPGLVVAHAVVLLYMSDDQGAAAAYWSPAAASPCGCSHDQHGPGAA